MERANHKLVGHHGGGDSGQARNEAQAQCSRGVWPCLARKQAGSARNSAPALPARTPLSFSRTQRRAIPASCTPLHHGAAPPHRLLCAPPPYCPGVHASTAQAILAHPESRQGGALHSGQQPQARPPGRRAHARAAHATRAQEAAAAGRRGERACGKPGRREVALGLMGPSQAAGRALGPGCGAAPLGG